MDTPLSVSRAYDCLRRASDADPYPTAEERHDRLGRLERLLLRHREALAAAISEDFGGRSRVESLLVEVMLTVEAIRALRRNLKARMRPTRVEVPWYLLPSRAWYQLQPKGAVAVLSPWNYPVNTALGPAAAALAAGNRVLVKPSELVPRTSALLSDLVRDHFAADELVVVTGGPDVATAITSLRWDHVFFTGSTQVGKRVARACGERLVPVTLELGGKSPAWVLPGYPVASAARRLAVAKAFNAGQTCIAPDFVLLPRGAEAAFAEAFFAEVARGYPALERNEQYTSLVSEKAASRIAALIEDAKSKGARVEPLPSQASPAARRVPPTLLFDVTEQMQVMQEEIFGPLLPVVGYRTVPEAQALLAARPRPLSLYLFDGDTRRVKTLLQQTHAGNVCLNDAMFQFAAHELPFGGVGDSGMGTAHGKWAFETFSYPKAVFRQTPLARAAELMRPPFGRTLEAALALVVGGRSHR